MGLRVSKTNAALRSSGSIVVEEIEESESESGEYPAIAATCRIINQIAIIVATIVSHQP